MLNMTVTPPSSGIPIPTGPSPPTKAERLRAFWLRLRYSWEDARIRLLTWWL